MSRAAGLVLAIGLIAGSSPGAARARARTYFIAIGENRSLSPGVAALEYADDDAAKSWELFSMVADRAALLAVLDLDTARLHEDAARVAELPDRATLFARLGQFNQEMERDLARGDEPELFIVYAGHGDVDENGEGFVTLHDGRLTRSELYRDVIARSKASFVHVVVDACKSYYLVRSRSGAWKDDAVLDDRSRDAVRGLLHEEVLDRHPRAGVIVATSGDRDTHEWSRFRGGILSHELRSALSGAADVNEDGRIEYSEVRAFIAAANASVRNAEVRLDTFARPPALDRRRPLLDLSRAQASGRGRVLRFGSELSGRFSIADERGVRYADVHKDEGNEVGVLVPAGRSFFVTRDDVQEIEIPAGKATVELAAMDWSRISIASRGAVEETFRRDLYLTPYGRRFYEGFVATSGDLPVLPSANLGRAGAKVTPGSRQRLSAAYHLSPSPIGEGGLLHGLALRWEYRLAFASLGLQSELGTGSLATVPREQSLQRLAFLGVLGFDVPITGRLSGLVDVAVGWQLLSGVFEAGGRRFEGVEPRAMRAELGAGLSLRALGDLSLRLRAGAVIDGVYSEPVMSSALNPFAELGVGWGQ